MLFKRQIELDKFLYLWIYMSAANTNTNNTPWNLQREEERWYNTIIPTIPSSLLLRTGLCRAWSDRVATVCHYSTRCNKSRTKCCLY
jgi:hypothetical protein